MEDNEIKRNSREDNATGSAPEKAVSDTVAEESMSVIKDENIENGAAEAENEVSAIQAATDRTLSPGRLVMKRFFPL